MGGTAVLVVEVVGVFPDVEGQEGFEALGDGVASVRFLGYHQGAVGVGGEPDPAATKEAHAFCFEFCLEGIQASPLLYNLCHQRSADQVGG